MHSRGKGISASALPYKGTPPSWLKISSQNRCFEGDGQLGDASIGDASKGMGQLGWNDHETARDASKRARLDKSKTDPHIILSLGVQVIRSKKNSETTVIGPPGEPIWNQVKNIVWSYASSIKSYKIFGDAVVFDTTHCLIAFDMPLRIWVGMNNYGRTWKRNHALWSLEIRIMRTTKLAAAEEKLHELERQKEERLRFGSPASLLQRLQVAMLKHERINVEKPNLITSNFLCRYTRGFAPLKRALIHLVAKTNSLS
ncbi:hypothetical protein FEM48_Zijuj03G0142300 [Ziziphus jujuba var. spinosa]|uniref:Small ribosomal subunit protein uS15 N-terminal domain-containing protein n=1 Tax=Ziziphus jujuba var. spinosa TaxID=714518 RepID=A0A978VQS8_ZIZJJ|nr:hypothetical protein FEM48_Zijuj03G0142300 [Ziziphus jujuba var. spinosa]